MESYAEQNECVLGIAAATPYSYFVIDLVESTDAQGKKYLHPYQRMIDRAQMAGGVNSAVLATLANPSLGRVGDIVLIEQERHATGEKEIGIPRGFGRPGLSGEDNALRELREETGYDGENVMRLGNIHIDSGLTDAMVTLYHITATELLPSAPEKEEAILGTHLLSIEEAWENILSGGIQDPFTIQALALFERQQLSK
jgi:ADP-ribose pyrophosphatase